MSFREITPNTTTSNTGSVKKIMQERHLDRKKYFGEQSATTEKYVIPFIRETIEINEDTSVLEIGCGEGGNLMPFLNIGCKRIVGVDMSKGKIENANLFFSDHPKKNNIKFVLNNIYDVGDIGQFDIILTRDVLEHIHGQERFMQYVKRFLKPGGKFFLGFPPWQSPFGGHQQICENKILSKLPYFHILPKSLYKLILKSFKESSQKIVGLLEIKETRISIERFEGILKKERYKKDKSCHYLINPNYEIKYGLKPRRTWNFFSSIPHLRNYLITTNYYVVSVDPV
jgi:2-polyprenyl-3-methyl-5-hydroxy-6-metoxy-1,4-benzoquinol methylase